MKLRTPIYGMFEGFIVDYTHHIKNELNNKETNLYNNEVISIQ